MLVLSRFRFLFLLATVVVVVVAIAIALAIVTVIAIVAQALDVAVAPAVAVIVTAVIVRVIQFVVGNPLGRIPIVNLQSTELAPGGGSSSDSSLVSVGRKSFALLSSLDIGS